MLYEVHLTMDRSQHINQSLFFLPHAAWLAEKQQMPILLSLATPDQDWTHDLLHYHTNHYTTDAALPWYNWIILILYF